MKRWKQIFFALVMMIGVLSATQSICAAEPYEKIANTNEWEVLKIVNKERAEQGLEPLAIFASLQKAAGVRAREISTYFSHNRPDGTSWFSVIGEQGIRCGCAGENIAAGYSSPSHVMNGWMNSDGHRENILLSSYSHIGVGYCTGGDYGKNWAQIFVGGCQVESIEVNGKETLNYPVGTSIDKMGRYLIVRCSDHGVGYVPIMGGMCKGYRADKTGSQTITVSYRGKKATFTVSVGDSTSVAKPAKVKNLKAVKKTKTTISLKWGKRKVAGYEVWMAKSKKGTYKKVKTITSPDRVTYKVKNLKSGKKYYFKVRAYKKSDNKKIYGSFSKAVVVKTK